MYVNTISLCIQVKNITLLMQFLWTKKGSSNSGHFLWKQRQSSQCQSLFFFNHIFAPTNAVGTSVLLWNSKLLKKVNLSAFGWQNSLNWAHFQPTKNMNINKICVFKVNVFSNGPLKWLRRQACRLWVCGSVNPISTRRGRLCPTNYYWHPLIFRPSYGPGRCLIIVGQTCINIKCR